jgi:hypothetical protein
MKKRESVMLRNAATDSLVLAVDHFNRAVGLARVEASLIFAHHRRRVYGNRCPILYALFT